MSSKEETKKVDWNARVDQLEKEALEVFHTNNKPETRIPVDVAEKLKTIETIIPRMGICSDGQLGVTNICRVLLGLKPLTDISGSDFGGYKLIVPIANVSSHNYPLNEPIMPASGLGRGVCITKLCKHGNYMDLDSKSWRPATPEEIKKFFIKFRSSVQFRLEECPEGNMTTNILKLA